jgi:hypothetical protein
MFYVYGGGYDGVGGGRMEECCRELLEEGMYLWSGRCARDYYTGGE